ncbi:MAG: Bug family tripartite tricarboxylate transporter substrate binding protein [Gemmatimonas sp.]
MRALGFAAAALALASHGAAAQSAADFYKGKQVNFVVSTATGGGYDAYARLMARHLGQQLAPDAKVVVQNMPGSGGIRAFMYIHSVAPKDGATLGMVHSGVALAPALGIEEAKFDPLAVTWIGSVNKEGKVCISMADSPVKTFSDTLTHEYIVGGSGGGSQMETYPHAMAAMFGAKIRVISGYKSGTEVGLAMERGEVMGRCGLSVTSIKSTRPDWIEKKMINFVVQTSLEPDPELAGVPMLTELAKSDRDRTVLEVLFADQLMDRPVLAPPGVPGDRAEHLRTAFKKTLEDKDFLADAAKQKLEIRYVSGDEIAALLKRVVNAPPDVLKAAGAFLKEGQ